MKITFWWPLFFILLVPVIIIMYLLKQKAKEQNVSSLLLWSEMVRNDRANTPWEKLKKNWLLVLQIITLLVLIVALMSPFFLSGLVSAGKTCIVIDTSASMGTIYEGENTRLDKAKEEAISYVKGLRTGTEITLVSSDRSAMILSSKSQDKSNVIDQIKNLTVSSYPGDTAEGIKLAQALNTEGKGLDVLVVTDSDTDVRNLDATVVDVFSEADNVGIEYVSHGYSENNLVVLAKVNNYGLNDAIRDVSLYQGDKLIDVKEVSVPAGESEVVYFDKVNLDAEVFFAQLSGKDGNDYDNTCYDILKEEKNSKVLLVTKANLYLEKALGLISNITVAKTEDIDSISDFEKQEYDLYIFDGMIPDHLPSKGNIIMFNCEYDEIARIEGYTENVIVNGAESVVTKYLDGMEFGVAGTYYYKVPDFAETILKCTTFDSEGNVSGTGNVAFGGEKDGRYIAMIGFDLHNSEFPLYMEFPLLMYNLVNECISGSTLNEYVYSSGDYVPINATLEAELPKVVKPDGTTVELSDYRVSFTNTDEYGAYLFTQNVDGKEESERFVVNYPISESDILTHPSLTVTNDENVVTEVKGVFNLRNIIIIIAMLLLSVEWIAGLRR